MKPHKRFYEIYLNDIARLLGDLRVEADHENLHTIPVNDAISKSELRKSVPWIAALHSLKSLSLVFDELDTHAVLGRIEHWIFESERKPETFLEYLKELEQGFQISITRAEPYPDSSPPDETSSPIIARHTENPLEIDHKTKSVTVTTPKNLPGRSEPEGARYTIRLFFHPDESLPLARLTVLLNHLANRGTVLTVEPRPEQLKGRTPGEIGYTDIELISPISVQTLRYLVAASGFIGPQISRMDTAPGEYHRRLSGNSQGLIQAFGEDSGLLEWLSFQRFSFLHRYVKLNSEMQSESLASALHITEPVASSRPSSEYLSEMITSYFNQAIQKKSRQNDQPNNTRTWELELNLHEVKLDSRALLTLQKIIVHLINNSLDHGGASEAPRITIELLPRDELSLEFRYFDNGPWYEKNQYPGPTDVSANPTAQFGSGRERVLSGRNLGLDIVQQCSEVLCARYYGPPVQPGPLVLHLPREITSLPIRIFKEINGNVMAIFPWNVVFMEKFSERKLIQTPGNPKTFYHANGRAFRLVSLLPDDISRIQDGAMVFAYCCDLPGSNKRGEEIIVGWSVADEVVLIAPGVEMVETENYGSIKVICS
jgi:hypothetical protein